MNKLYKNFRNISLLLLLLVVNYTNAQIPQQITDSLQSKLNQIRAAHGVKGVSAAVYMPQLGTWKGATGVSFGPIPIDTNMLFSIGSITKTFVAAEIMKLHEQGLLDIDDYITDYLPQQQYVDSTITIRQCLNHTSGLGDVTNAQMQDAVFNNLNRRWYMQEVVDSFLTPPQFAPGQAWQYCNANYFMLGMIIENVTQDSLTHVLRNDLFDPFNLNETYVHMYEQFSNPMPHHWANPTMTPGQGVDVSFYPHEALWTTIMPAGGIFSSPADIAHWGYSLYTGQVINQSSLDEMLSFIPINSYFTGYGLGCSRFEYQGETYIGHGGNYFGYAASMFFHPDDSISIGLLVNEDCISPYLTMDLFYELLNMITLDVKNIQAKNDFSIFPNPASDELTLKYVLNGSETNVRIYSATGSLFFERKVNNTGLGEMKISVQDFPSGIYFCELQNEKGTSTQKIIVE